IVFITFSSTAANPDFSAALPRLGVPMAYMAFSHVVLVGLAYLGARLLRFELPDQITAVFTAPQKTMAMGVPLLTVYFASDPAIMGFALMPLLMYHPWQLLIGGLLRSHFRQRVAARAC